MEVVAPLIYFIIPQSEANGHTNILSEQVPGTNHRLTDLAQYYPGVIPQHGLSFKLYCITLKLLELPLVQARYDCIIAPCRSPINQTKR